MRILLACDVKTNGRGNPFTLQLLHALETHPDVEAVQHGTSWMKIPEAKFDIVHIHWPEMLTNFSEPTAKELREIQETFERWSRESAIVATIHNEYPHRSNTKPFKKLYKAVYSYVDGVIHMGEKSKKVMRKQYRDDMERADEVVIPHGNYACFPNEISQKEARLELGLPLDANVFVSFGNIRSMDEWKLLYDGFRSAKIPNSYLLVAANMPYRHSRSHWQYWRVRISVYMSSDMKREEGFIPPERVQYYMNAADVTVIPRKDTLNSGNVSLGFTFGTVVTGPNVGVIGETLEKTGNPTFDPTCPQSVVSAFSKAMEQKNIDLPSENKIYSKNILGWRSIANKHTNHYLTVLKNKNIISYGD